MGIRITRKDREIFEFIDDFGFITIQQCAKIMFKGHKRAYEEARTKLKRLADNGILNSDIFPLGSCKVFTLPAVEYQRNISEHRMVLLNLYAEIYNHADNVQFFKIDQQWKMSPKKREVDGHIVFTMKEGTDEEYAKTFFIEVDVTHKTKQNKYEEIYNSQVVQEWYKDHFGEEVFPDILIVSRIIPKKKLENTENYSYFYTDYNFTNLHKFL